MRNKLNISILLVGVITALAACNGTTENKAATEATAISLEQAQEYALATQKVLGKNLLNAMNMHGVAGAVAFCNVQALPLTDSMSVEKNVSISRLTDQPRNPRNAATGAFALQIADFKSHLAQGHKPAPTTLNIDGKNYHCIPILTNAMCLNCHGDKAINAETQIALKTLYPNDKATGYTENQVRGMWVVHSL